MKAVIFDMDGILIDSEPLWHIVEKEAFGAVGIILTDAMCEETTGLRTEAVVAYWYDRQPWPDKRQATVADEIIAGMAELVDTHGGPMAGVVEILDDLVQRPLRLGVASSSPPALIDKVIDKLGIRSYFHALCSAIHEEFGKPHPAVYMTAAARLEVEPHECLVFEDSIAGVRAAKAAGMTTVAVPASHQYSDHRFTEADLKLRSLCDFSWEMVI